MGRDLIEVRALDRAALDHIWANLRERDREELRIQGADDSNYFQFLDGDYAGALVGCVNGEPVAAFGTRLIHWESDLPGFTYPALLGFWLFATPAVRPFWKRITKGARFYLKNKAREHLDVRALVVTVWEKHEDSRRWLRLLGFVETGAYRIMQGERILLLHKPDW